MTNSIDLQQQINCSEHKPEIASIPTSKPFDETRAEAAIGLRSTKEVEQCKVLGLSWIPAGDRLTFDVSGLAKIANELQPTKRNVISLVGRFYDPLGYLSPVTIQFKILFQKLCHNKLTWVITCPKS